VPWTDGRKLCAIKAVHTAAWAFFAACILAIPPVAWWGDLRWAGALCGMVAVEVLVVLAFGWRCPLTPLAARYTSDRRDNFDIFLPEWLARHNKMLFGTLYVVGLAVAGYRWLNR